MTTDLNLLRQSADEALAYVAGVDERDAAPSRDQVAALEAFDETLPIGPQSAAHTIQLLASTGGPATMASAGPSYFGFVTGATLPVALGAAFLTSAWDQNAALPAMSPIGAKLFDVTRGWLCELLGLAPTTDMVYVTGATVANATCLAAARDALLAEHGWDCPTRGLYGAPELQVVLGAHSHSTIRKSLSLIGLGSERVHTVPADDQGRMRADLLPDLSPADGPIIVIAQAGEVNSGAFDPFDDIADWATQRRAWLHVDGAFGLWALADPELAHLVVGLTRADSLATDGHKWLNVTYDCGLAFVQRRGALRRTFAAMAGYLPPADGFEPMHHTPQSSQRARQIEVWAVLRTLGRQGVASLVHQACQCATAIADGLRDVPGMEILNDVVLNQILVRYRDPPTTAALIDEIQRDGRIWCGPTQWLGEVAMRVSVSSWKTTLDDAERAHAIIAECAGRLGST